MTPHCVPPSWLHHGLLASSNISPDTSSAELRPDQAHGLALLPENPAGRIFDPADAVLALAIRTPSARTRSAPPNSSRMPKLILFCDRRCSMPTSWMWPRVGIGSGD